MDAPTDHIYAQRARYAIDKHHQRHADLLQKLPTLEEMRSNVTMKPADAANPICIIGAGMAGLYTAMILQDLNISYQILEADYTTPSDPEQQGRPGGRMFTKQFDDPNKTGYEYFDVGAMRFPDTPFMRRTFDLVQNPKRGLTGVNLIPYTKVAGKTLMYFNNTLVCPDLTTPPTVVDPFGLNDGTVPSYIDPTYLQPGQPQAFLENEIYGPLKQPFLATPLDFQEAFETLYANYDQYSLRSYLIEKFNLSTADIHYMETFDKSTGWYDRALTESVIESLAFEWPTNNSSDPNAGWFCFDKGSSTLPLAMAQTLTTSIKYGATVTGIAQDGTGLMNVVYNDATQSGSQATGTYSAVISTVTLPCLAMMDLSGCAIAGTNYPQWSAIRELQYGPSIKIGVQFTSPWWEDPTIVPNGKIVGGQSFTDLPLRTIVYPSYPANAAGPKSDVLIASYCWTGDAERLGAWMNGDGTADPRLMDLVLRDLAAVHGTTVDVLQGFYEGQYFAWDWLHNPNTMGAYAFFGPGEFVDQVYAQICDPAAGGQLFIAGEATSSCHAWVAGALDSAWRAVYQYLSLHNPVRLPEFLLNWGPSEYWSDEQLENHLRLAIHSFTPSEK